MPSFELVCGLESEASIHGDFMSLLPQDDRLGGRVPFSLAPPYFECLTHITGD